jgi:hypothetical protein
MTPAQQSIWQEACGMLRIPSDGPRLKELMDDYAAVALPHIARGGERLRKIAEGEG